MIKTNMREGNPITNELPPAIDSFLQDLAQMCSSAKFDYSDVSNFAKRCTPENIKELRKLRAKYRDAATYDDELEMDEIGKKVTEIVKPSKISESTLKFSPSEVKVIHDRIEVENEWGESVYDPAQLKTFKSILDKCNTNTDGNIDFTPEELKAIEDRLDIECHEWGGKVYDENDLEDMEMVLGKIRRSKIN